MRYMLMFVDTDTDWSGAPDEERDRMFQTIGAWWGKHSESGKIVGGEQLQPAATAKTVTHTGNGKTVVTDGPFIEAKEHLVGYCLLECETLERATEIAVRWPDARHWAVELRPIMIASGEEM